MKRIIFYNLLIIISLATGCRKMDLEPIDGTPVFTADAKFGDTQKSWQAGVDGYYMFSAFEKDALDVYEFSGSFAQKDSLDDGEILTFSIRDNEPRPQGLPDINAALDQNLLFASISGTEIIWKTIIDTTGYSTIFDATNSIIPNTPVAYEWTFGDGNSDSISGSIAQYTYSQLPTEPVTLNIKALNNSCSSTLTKSLNILGNSPECDLNMEAYLLNPVGDSLFIIKAIPIGTAPFSFIWNNGTSEESLEILVSSGLVGGAVTVTDANGCTISGSVSTTLLQGTIPPICIAQFSNSPIITLMDSSQVIDTIITGDMIQLSRARIEYTDIEGTFYSSFFNPQPSFSFIKVVDTDDYDDNEKGEKTKKITLEYSCRIWSEAGDFIDLTNGRTTIAIAYP